MQFTKTTTRAFAASLVMVAAGGTIAGAAVFHLPILGLGRADVASANSAPAAGRTAPVARKKVRPKVIVRTRYADQIVHVPAPSRAPLAATAAPASAAPATQTSSLPGPAEVAAEPDETTTVPSPATTVAEHDDEGDHEYEHEHEDADEPDEVEHAHHVSDDSVEQR